MNKINTKTPNIVSFSGDNEEFYREESSLSLNPLVTYAKFVLTDNLPNGNKHRIPEDEFDNIIKTGVFMPVKMAEGQISPGHDNTKPIGVITHLKKEETPSGMRVVALAVLWGLERPEDVEYIKRKMEEDGSVDVSWEISYKKMNIEEGGVKVLRDVILNAATIVGNPAYQGRTRFLAIAAHADPWSEAYINDLPDSSFLYIAEGGTLDSEGKTTPRELRKLPVRDANGYYVAERIFAANDELGKLNLPDEISEGVRLKIRELISSLNDNKLSVEGEPEENTDMEANLESLDKIKEEYEKEISALTAKVSELESKLSEAEAKVGEMETAKSELDNELELLREFKRKIEEKEARELKIAEIKKKFVEAGLDKDDEYFDKNTEMLLGLSDNELDFLIQELVAFAEKAEASLKLNSVPRGITDGTPVKLSPKDIAKALKERKTK